MLTQKEYLEKEGTVCPVCGSNEIRGGEPEFNGPIIYEDVRCTKCEFLWFETYELKSFSIYGQEDPE
jgi:ssDNA-binding Zn-finger/Zn-ribbon topoisomerase 1